MFACTMNQTAITNIPMSVNVILSVWLQLVFLIEYTNIREYAAALDASQILKPDLRINTLTNIPRAC